ncbi:MAG: DUF2164 domain-containing protein [Vicinamibacterales bacterium]
MSITLDPTRRGALTERLQAFFQDEFDQDLSPFRAEQVLDFMLAALGPSVYNQAVQDARKFIQQRLDDLDGEVHEPDLG